MAKIIECASLCCVPGGRDSILATLDDDGFVLESMAEQRRATPVSVAAHSLYEQADPFTVYEPEGRLDLQRRGLCGGGRPALPRHRRGVARRRPIRA